MGRRGRANADPFSAVVAEDSEEVFGKDQGPPDEGLPGLGCVGMALFPALGQDWVDVCAKRSCMCIWPWDHSPPQCYRLTTSSDFGWLKAGVSHGLGAGAGGYASCRSTVILGVQVTVRSLLCESIKDGNCSGELGKTLGARKCKRAHAHFVQLWPRAAWWVRTGRGVSPQP